MADDDNKAHPPLDEPHPAGTGERTDREVGGPKSAETAEASEPGSASGSGEDDAAA